MTSTEREKQNLLAFLQPIAEAAGLKIRPFGLNAFNRLHLLGLTIFTPAYAAAKGSEQHMQMVCFLVLQTAPLADVDRWVREYLDRWQDFYWDKCSTFFPEDLDLGLLGAIQTQAAETAPAIEAASIEAVESSATASSGERPPPNT
jgi:hypothetical protein